jgi:hypothetical protein
MLVVQAQNKRGDGSTSLVHAVPYGIPPPSLSRFAPPQLSRRAKIGIGLAGITLLATITTIAIAHSGGKSKAPVAAAPTPTKSQPPPKPTPAPAPAPTPPPPAPIIAKQPDPPKPPPVEPTKPAPNVALTPAPTPPPPTPKIQPKPDPTPPTPTVIARRPDPKPDPKPDPAPVTARPDPKPDPKPAPKRTASADDARDKADQLYKDKHFIDAANVMFSAAKSADPDAAKELKLRGQRYSQLARAYNQGMAPGAEPDEAFEALRTASTFDQNVGGEFAHEIADKLKQVVPRAAISFLAGHELEKAHTAVLAADQLGLTSNDSIKAVRSKLEQEAGNIYGAAKTAGFTTPDGKDKLRKIKAIVDSTSQWYQKASAALSGSA